MTLLNTYGAISYERIHVILSSLLGVRLSTATLAKMVKKCAKNCAPVLQNIRDCLVKNNVNHFDETGVRVNGKLYWVHNSSSADYTFQTINKKRGKEGIDANGVIPNSTGVAVHDCWGTYWKYTNVVHAVCCAHLLRELAGIQDNEPSRMWPEQFAGLLIRMKSKKQRDIDQGKQAASPYHLHKFSREYDRILKLADDECPLPPESTEKKKGRRKKGKERSLIERLSNLKAEVCRFFTDYIVPFDNNQAERDIRNTKTKSKVSGCFRTEEGAQDYCTLTSYINGTKAWHKCF